MARPITADERAAIVHSIASSQRLAGLDMTDAEVDALWDEVFGEPDPDDDDASAAAARAGKWAH
jgi:hypothetical protein